MENNKFGYSSACCAVATVLAACRTLVRGRAVSTVQWAQDAPRVFVTNLTEKKDCCRYARKNYAGIRIFATAVWNDEAGVKLSFGEGIRMKNGLPMIAPEVLTLLLTVLSGESKGKAVCVTLSADAEIDSFIDFSEYSCPQQKTERTAVILLGKNDPQTVCALKECYGEDAVCTQKAFSEILNFTLKKAVKNVIFTGKIESIARFLGIPVCQASGLFGAFSEGHKSFWVASSPDLLGLAQNTKTLELFNRLSEENKKAGILITQTR